jgi:hypothetical protein
MILHFTNLGGTIGQTHPSRKSAYGHHWVILQSYPTTPFVVFWVVVAGHRLLRLLIPTGWWCPHYGACPPCELGLFRMHRRSSRVIIIDRRWRRWRDFALRSPPPILLYTAGSCWIELPFHIPLGVSVHSATRVVAVTFNLFANSHLEPTNLKLDGSYFFFRWWWWWWGDSVSRFKHGRRSAL